MYTLIPSSILSFTKEHKLFLSSWTNEYISDTNSPATYDGYFIFCYRDLKSFGTLGGSVGQHNMPLIQF